VRFRGLTRLAALVLPALLLGACYFGSMSRIPQTHFTYPNSNVIPLGETRGSATKLCGLGFQWAAPGGEEGNRAIEEALRRKGGDLLINAQMEAGTWNIPLGLPVTAVLSMLPIIIGQSAGLTASEQQDLMIMTYLSPLGMLLNMFFCKTKIAGTAAKMEIGLQELHPMARQPGAAAPPAVAPARPGVQIVVEPTGAPAAVAVAPAPAPAAVAPAPAPAPPAPTAAAVDESTRERARQAKAEGDRLRQAKNYDRAVAAYRRAVGLWPGFAKAQNSLGKALYKQKDLAGAEMAYAAAVQADPNYALALFNLGFTRRKQSRFAEAEEPYRRYIELEPDDPDGHYGLAMVLEKLGRNKEAAEHYRRYTAMETRASERKWVGEALKKAGALEQQGDVSAPCRRCTSDVDCGASAVCIQAEGVNLCAPRCGPGVGCPAGWGCVVELPDGTMACYPEEKCP